MWLYLTRHGKTQWNVERRFQGVMDSPLLEQGEKDAYALKKRIADIPLNQILTSPLQRAFKTASIIAGTVPVQADERLKEMNFGAAEGMKTGEIIQKYPELYDDLWNHPERFTRFDNGESFDEVAARLSSLISELRVLDDDRHILLVGHGMVLVVLQGLLRGLEKKDYPLINRAVLRGCSLTKIHLTQKKAEFIYVNQDDFLPFEKPDSYVVTSR